MFALAEGGGESRSGKDCQAVLLSKTWVQTGSACVMQGAELFDQQFAGDQFQFEVKRALHEDLYGFLRGHGIHLPWEWLFASFAYLIGSFAGELDCGKRKGVGACGGKGGALPLVFFLLVDTIEKIQHNSYDNNIVFVWE